MYLVIYVVILLCTLCYIVVHKYYIVSLRKLNHLTEYHVSGYLCGNIIMYIVLVVHKYYIVSLRKLNHLTEYHVSGYLCGNIIMYIVLVVARAHK